MLSPHEQRRLAEIDRELGLDRRLQLLTAQLQQQVRVAPGPRRAGVATVLTVLGWLLVPAAIAVIATSPWVTLQTWVAAAVICVTAAVAVGFVITGGAITDRRRDRAGRCDEPRGSGTGQL